AAQALGREQDVRLDAFVFARPHLARAADAALDLVADEQDAVAVADRAQVLEVAGRRHDVAALALDGLHENGGDAVRRHFLGEQFFLDPRRTACGAGRLAAAILTAIAI